MLKILEILGEFLRNKFCKKNIYFKNYTKGNVIQKINQNPMFLHHHFSF
jgi:hypothetical protein